MTDTAIRPEAWTPIERLNVREHGRRGMDRVGVVEPAKLNAGAQFVIAWGPRGDGPGVCIARYGSRRGHVAHTPDDAWNPHNPDWPDEALESYAQDAGMFHKRRRHDLDAGFPAVEVWSAGMRRLE